jgi:RNA polymerase sigma factor (sigma-70 family)
MDELNNLVSNFNPNNFARIVKILDPILKAELKKSHHKQNSLNFDDILQNTLIDLHDILMDGKFNPALSSFKTFAIKILKNKSYNEDRKNCSFKVFKEKLISKQKHEKLNASDSLFENALFKEYLKKWDKIEVFLDPRTRKILSDLQNHPLSEVKAINNLSDLQYFRIKKTLLSKLENSVFSSSRT